jgi:3-deoxy-D-arabino-heptulosonate 7-phosphate (DAHP) synthase class II
VITGFDGQSKSVLQKGPTRWGEAYYLLSCPLNLVSVSQLSTLGYMKMTSDARGFVATSPDGESYEFLYQSNGLLNHQLEVNCCATGRATQAV